MNEIQPMNMNGVSMKTFQDFIDFCGDECEIQHLTTTDINVKFLIPLTSQSKISYCEHLQRIGSSEVASATVFISHAWKYKFLDVFKALKRHFADSPNEIIWFDLFSNNQHVASSLPFDWWTTVFRSAIAKFSRTVMILSPWNDPVPLTRAWCLYELFCTIDTKSRFEIAMTDDDILLFNRAEVQDISKMISDIDVKRSESTNPSDKEKIFEVVEKTVGFSSINSIILKEMRTWTFSSLLSAISVEKDEITLLTYKRKISVLYFQCGNIVESDRWCTSSLQECKASASVGDYHVLTFRFILLSAQLLRAGGKVTECVELLEAQLPHVERTFSSISDIYVDFLRSLSGAYERIQTDSTKWENIQRIVMGLHQHDFTTEFQPIVDVPSLKKLYDISNFGIGLVNRDRFEEADPLYRYCLNSSREHFGYNHPFTLHSMNNLAWLCFNMKKYDECEKLYLECVTRQLERLGEDHPDTLTNFDGLAYLYFIQGRLHEAKDIWTKNVRLGSGQPRTFLYEHNLENAKILIDATDIPSSRSLTDRKAKWAKCVDRSYDVLGQNAIEYNMFRSTYEDNLPESVTHKCHNHHLHRGKDKLRFFWKCSLCFKTNERETKHYICVQCDFIVHPSCLLFPESVVIMPSYVKRMKNNWVLVFSLVVVVIAVVVVFASNLRYYNK